jgi:hypothetical protein
MTATGHLENKMENLFAAVVMLASAMLFVQYPVAP